MRKYLRWLPLVLLGYALWKLKPWQTEFSRLNPWPLVLGLAVNLGIYMPIRVLRWRTTIVDPPSFMRLYWAQVEGSAVGGAVGFGAQDVIRAARVRTDMSRFSDDFGSTMTERFAEMQALAILFAVAAAAGLVPLWGWLPCLATPIVLYVIAKLGHRLAITFSRWPKIARAMVATSSSLTVSNVAKVVGFSLLGWGVEIGILVLNFIAFSLPALASNALLVVIGINVAIAVPGPPANVGTFEAGVAGILTMRGITADKALAFAIAYHVIMAVPIYAMGGVVVLLRAYRKTQP
jgi:uncharacterized membrane protein YbhN (UPF0104 family)